MSPVMIWPVKVMITCNVDGFQVKDQSNVKGVQTLRELLVIYQSVNGIEACGTEDTELY